MATRFCVHCHHYSGPSTPLLRDDGCSRSNSKGAYEMKAEDGPCGPHGALWVPRTTAPTP
jgi:hypothetical protein